MNGRAGHYERRGRFNLFIPAPLPPNPPVAYNERLVTALADSSAALGRLAEATRTFPHPELFMSMYVKKEAVLSSQIEGTQSTLDDLLRFEAGDLSRESAREVVRHVDAIMFGLERLNELPLSLRLIREIHSVLLKGVRGEDRTPGEFRNHQVVVGGVFYPPPPGDLRGPLDNFEKFLHDQSFPPLIQAGIAHAQFETIHPFGDGNGRMGRLLITMLLCSRGSLDLPLLYLSHYLLENRQEYYGRLTGIRDDGDWESWLEFFCDGVKVVSDSAIATARQVESLREELENKISAKKGAGPRDRLALEAFFVNPIMSVGDVADRTHSSFATAAKSVERLEAMGAITEITGRSRDRRYRFDWYVNLFQK